MRLGLIGLGRMGANMARRLARGGHEVVGYDRDPAAGPALAKLESGLESTADLAALVAALPAPRAVWIMVPAGAPTENTVRALADLMAPGDLLADGGNSHYKDSARRAAELAARGIMFVDAGTSGGLWGLERGYCLMAGGTPEAVALLAPVLECLAPGEGTVEPTTPGPSGRAATGEHLSTASRGWLHCGPAGAGHFTKMIHNGIEYGMMQAYAEGFDIMANASGDGLPPGLRYDIDLPAVAELWRRGSVVSSWLLDLTARALAEDPALDGFTGRVADSGEGRWTIEAAMDEAVPVPVLAASLFARFRSRQTASFADKLLSAMRKQFGGHAEALPAKENSRA